MQFQALNFTRFILMLYNLQHKPLFLQGFQPTTFQYQSRNSFFFFHRGLTRLLDPGGGVGDGLLGPVPHSVCDTGVGTWGEAAWCRAPRCPSDPIVPLIARPPLPVTVLGRSAGALMGWWHQIELVVRIRIMQIRTVNMIWICFTLFDCYLFSG